MSRTSILAGLRAAYFTLGCKLNFAETSAVAERLRALGVTSVGKGERADVCIINTCSVTEVADSKGRQAVRRMARLHPGAVVVVMGCYAQLKPEEVGAIEGVDLVLGTEEKARLVDHLCECLEERVAGEAMVRVTTRAEIRDFAPSCSCGNRTRYFLKVQDGCDYFCTYCTIPMARGRSRNGTIASLVRQAEDVAARGGKEIVITGVNIGDFGKTTGETLLDLLRALDGVDGIARYRISSIEPNLLSEELLRFCAESRAFMPHFHLPLQCGSDEVLRLMHRHYDTSLFASKVGRIRELMPDAFIGVDVIVGTRGETEALFAEARTFMDSLDVSQYHVFSYSERAGTAALRIPHAVSPAEKHARSQEVIAISERKLAEFYRRHLGTVRPVLLERGRRKGVLTGWTDNYIKVEVTSARDNEIVAVRLGDWNKDKTALMGTII